MTTRVRKKTNKKSSKRKSAKLTKVETNREGLPQGKEKKRKRNNGAPEEISSKVPAGRFRYVVHGSTSKRRDPRFEDPDANTNSDLGHFRQAYGFLDDLKNGEIAELEKDLKKAKSKESKEKLKSALQRYRQERKDKERIDRQRKLKSQWSKQEFKLQKDGKQPYFLKKSEQKKLELVDRYEELKSDGKLKTYMEKRRKKNAMKDKRKFGGLNL